LLLKTSFSLDLNLVKLISLLQKRETPPYSIGYIIIA